MTTPTRLGRNGVPFRSDHGDGSRCTPAADPGDRFGCDPAAIEARWRSLDDGTGARECLLDAVAAATAPSYARNVENYIGTVRVPVGVAGPLRVHGERARGDYMVPLATTEATLVASYGRGARLLTEAGGCTARVTRDRLQRAPGFIFESLDDAMQFARWAQSSIEGMRRAAATTTRYGRLEELRVTIQGNHAYLILEFTTGDAAGQNMVTIATDAICRFVHEHAPVRARTAYVEANHSGDKKASAQALALGRGRSVSAEAVIPAALIERRLHATVDALLEYWRMSAIGAALSGSLGLQGHYANGLAALFLACGQDVACVAESAVGVTRFEKRGDGSLYASVTLPNLVVGTVGGGTGLPSQHACLRLLGLAGAGHANTFAELCAALVLAGELSIVGALAAGHFTDAHRRLARGAEEAR